MITMRFSAVLYDRNYNETLALLTKSEHFLKNYTAFHTSAQDQVQDLRINCEMTRVTSRLTQIMAWILAQKAAINGEITPEEANSEKFRIKDDPFCLANSINGREDEYPLPVRELLSDSLILFRRILNLSRQLNEDRPVTSLDQTCRTLN